MTNTPKSRWGFNSVLNDVPAKEEAADKAKNAKVKADPNAGAPKDEEPVSEAKRNAAIAAAAATPEVEAPKAALAQMRDINGDPTKIDSVRGPSDGAPIGYGVHKLALEGGNPYAAKQMYRAEEPVPNLQHQPVILQPGVAPAAPAPKEMTPEMAYRTKIGEEGV
jgi:hypothetical protein